MQLNIKYTGPKEYFPKYASKGANGIDLVNNEEKVTLVPGASAVLSTGVFAEIPVGYVGLLFVRSGLGFKNNTVLTNAVGVIDSDYRGEIKAKLINNGNTEVTIDKYDRFCQLVLVPSPQFVINNVDTLSDTDRGEGGFGSTGKK